MLNNIIKHAGAKSAEVSLSQSDHQIILKVEDDGVGFETEELHTGLGLKNILGRVEILQGKAIINSQKTQGTAIIVEIPVN